jgi:uncharacterized protein
MPWLLRGGEVLASLEIAETFRPRLVGLLGRSGIEGALLIRPARAVHSLGMRFPLDVAYLDAELRVLRTRHLPRHRVALPVPRARCVLEAEAGAFAAWGLVEGDELEVQGA